jgi:hypothetical protein
MQISGVERKDLIDRRGIGEVREITTEKMGKKVGEKMEWKVVKAAKGAIFRT